MDDQNTDPTTGLPLLPADLLALIGQAGATIGDAAPGLAQPPDQPAPDAPSQPSPQPSQPGQPDPPAPASAAPQPTPGQPAAPQQPNAPGTSGGGQPGHDPAIDSLMQMAQQMMDAARSADQQATKAFQALSATNEQDFQERVREWNIGHEFAVQQFQQGVLQWNASFAQQQHQFNTNTAVDLTKTAAGLTGPADYFKFLNMTNGGKSILGSLTDPQGKPAFGGFQVTPQPQSLEHILGALGINLGSMAPTAATAGASPAGAPGQATSQSAALTAAAAPGGLGAASSGAAPGQINQFGTYGYAPGATVTSVAPGQSGPSSPQDTTFGIAQRQQNFGKGVGQGGTEVSGERGITRPTATGFNTGDMLNFDWRTLSAKGPNPQGKPAFFQLIDKNTGQTIGYEPFSGSGGNQSMMLWAPLDQSHNFELKSYLPGEMGTGESIQFNGSELGAAQETAAGKAAGDAARQYLASRPVGMDQDQAMAQARAAWQQAYGATPAAAPAASPQAAPPSAPAPSPMAQPSTPPAVAPTEAAGFAADQPGATQKAAGISLPNGMGSIPFPHQINPATWDAWGKTGQEFIKAAAAAGGFDPTEFERQINATRPGGASFTPGATTYAGAGASAY